MSDNKEHLDHNNDCDCGDDCNHDHEAHNTVTLILEDNTELVCPIIAIFEDEDQEYIALLHPIEETAMIYKFYDYEDGTIEVTPIEDDEAYDRVTKVFMDLEEE